MDARGDAAVVGGGAALGAQRDDGATFAASARTDAEILNLFLTLERLQAAFYRAALDGASLGGDLQRFATTALGQEEAHAAFLEERLGSRAGDPPESDFGDDVTSPDRFRDAAVELEEATLAVYIGQGPNLRSRVIPAAATLVSVEARQAAWIRDIAGLPPAPRPADPARRPQAVLADFRDRRWLR
jgi:Ferritin-like domain